MKTYHKAKSELVFFSIRDRKKVTATAQKVDKPKLGTQFCTAALFADWINTQTLITQDKGELSYSVHTVPCNKAWDPPK